MTEAVCVSDRDSAASSEPPENYLAAAIGKWRALVDRPERTAPVGRRPTSQVGPQILQRPLTDADNPLAISLADRFDPTGVWVDHRYVKMQHFDEAKPP